MSEKEILGVLAIVVGFIAYIPYLWLLIKRQIKPHIFSWFIWGLLTAIAFAAQIEDGAGPGAWVTGFTAMVSFIIVALSFKYGEKDITKSDCYSFVGALAAIPLWYITKDPLWAVILVTIIDALAFYPTFRKSYYKPNEETMITYTLSGIKFIIALMALERFTVTTALYPLSLVIMNGAFVIMLLWRRRTK